MHYLTKKINKVLFCLIKMFIFAHVAFRMEAQREVSTVNSFPNMNIAIIVAIVVIALVFLISALVVWGVWTNNMLVAKRNKVLQCRSSIGVVLKQRNDLIPNLVETVKVYMTHEKDTLAEIAKLRSSQGGESVSQMMRRDRKMSKCLMRVNVMMEKYPALKANEQFQHLRNKMSEMECELQAIRRTYNAAVVDYNNMLEMFPSSLFARYYRLAPEALLEFSEEETADLNVANQFNA